MKLSDLVEYRNNLLSMIPVDSASFVHEKLATILHTVKTSEFQSTDNTHQLEKDYNSIIENIANFENTVDKVCDSINQTIEHLEVSYYQESDVLYNEMMDHDSVEHILNRRFSTSDSALKFITARIQLHGNWQHAGLIIRPGRENWVDMLVGCDPLYLVDTNLELLQPAVLRFNDQYQRRLRTYEVNERDVSGKYLEHLPSQQFAYCLAYNFFNFKPESVILNYISEVYQLLKPGGTFAFTINDGDYHGAVRLAEQHYSFYTPGHKIQKHAEQQGFVIKQRYRINSACYWIEVEKPGTLKSLRGGQTLAEIHPNT